MDEKDMPRVGAYFTITQNSEERLDLERITQLLGITPTRARKLEEFPLASQEQGVAGDSWQYETFQETGNDINEPIGRIISLFKGKAAIIADMRREMPFETKLCVPVHTNMEKGYPKMQLSSDVIRFLSIMDSDFSVDLYRY